MRHSIWGHSARLIALLSLLLIGVPLTAVAQVATGAQVERQQRQNPGQRTDQQRAELLRRLRAQYNRMIQENLGLDDEQVARVSEITERYRQERTRLSMEERQLQRRLIGPGTRRRGPGQAGFTPPDLTDEEAREILQRQNELLRAEFELFRDEQEELLQVVSPADLLGLYSFRTQLNERIQQIQGRLGGPGRGGRGGGQRS